MKNKVIDIFGEKYKIQFVDVITDHDDDNYFYSGQTNSAKKTIKIAIKDVEGNPMPEKYIKSTLLHELIHAILNSGMYFDYSSDEPMVEWITRCLISLMDQKVI